MWLRRIAEKLREWWDSLDEPAFEFQIGPAGSKFESKIRKPAISFSAEPVDDTGEDADEEDEEDWGDWEDEDYEEGGNEWE